jgi:threonine/homoserine/homoserine lactone efflux protein
MSLEQAAAFFLFALVAAVTPGPSNVLLTAAGASAGVLGGLPCLFGVSAGMGSMLLLMASGLAGVGLAHPAVLPIIKLCGAGFLLWLAWRIATARGNASGVPAGGVTFFDAAALQWVNPKAWVVSAGAAATYLAPDQASAVAQSLTFVLVFVLAALPCGFLWLAFGAVMQARLKDAQRRRAFNVAMAVALAASVVMMVR